jgi:hypothetical protein
MANGSEHEVSSAIVSASEAATAHPGSALTTIEIATGNDLPEDREIATDDDPIDLKQISATVKSARAASTATEHAQQTQNLGLPKLCGEWSSIFGFVGAHNLEAIWRCSECNPSWYNWDCHHCEKSVPPAWTTDRHFGGCGQSCRCWRHEAGDWLGACHILWVPKTVSWDMRLTLRSYNGR